MVPRCETTRRRAPRLGGSAERQMVRVRPSRYGPTGRPGLSDDRITIDADFNGVIAREGLNKCLLHFSDAQGESALSALLTFSVTYSHRKWWHIPVPRKPLINQRFLRTGMLRGSRNAGGPVGGGGVGGSAADWSNLRAYIPDGTLLPNCSAPIHQVENPLHHRPHRLVGATEGLQPLHRLP